MNFDEKLKQYINETPIPENLMPENIINLLENEKVSELALTAKQRHEDTSVERNITPVPSLKKRTWVRAAAMIAACAVIGVGVFTHFYDGGFTLNKDNAIINSLAAIDVKNAADYESLFTAMNDFYKTSLYHFDYVDEVTEDTIVTGVPGGSKDATDDAEIETGGSGSDRDKGKNEYSKTNEQVEGVAEADVIKTDGEYIYYISQNRLIIVSANNGEMELISNTKRDNITPVEMFLVGERLVVISNEYSRIELPYYPEGPKDDVIISPSEGEDAAQVPSDFNKGGSTPAYNPDEPTAGGTDGAQGGGSDASVAADIPAGEIADLDIGAPDIAFDLYWRSYNSMFVEIYDISDKSSPTPVSTYKQNGAYISSRMIGDKLYLISSYDNFAKPGSVDDLDSYVPFYYENDEKMYIQPIDICLPGRVVTSTYTIVSGLDITKAEPLVSTKALLGYSGNVYSSLENVYVTCSDYRNEGEYTNITRFAIADGNIAHAASGTVNGYIINQFAMDEFDGNFRIATTIRNWVTAFNNDGTASALNNTSSGVYVLDSNLSLLGKVDGLAKGETIQSVRFDKELAYVVTFFQTDPLFAIDLSNPSSPTVLDELKVTGFSAYMHKWNDGLLLGFGNEADPETGFTTGLKLSMFDIADSTKLSEVSKIYFNDDGGKTYEYSPAQYNHKAILVAPEKNLIGIPVQHYDGFTNVNQYFAFGYNENGGLFLRGVIEYSDVDWQFNFERGLYIGDVLYAVSQGRLVSARIDDLAVIKLLDISTNSAYDYGKTY